MLIIQPLIDPFKLLKTWSVMQNFMQPILIHNIAHLEVDQFLYRIFNWVDALCSAEPT